MQPLKGLKVVDFTTWIMAPVCAATLGDWGAEVIKIEDPASGDTFRWFLMNAGIDESEIPVSLFGMNNRNKKGMAVDLRTPEGKDIMYKLIEGADIFVSNIPRESLKKLGLDYGSLADLNPRLIYAHATGFGPKGPDADKPGFDGTTYWARSGLMSALADKGQPPIGQKMAGIGDQVSGLVFFGGVLLAIINREKTGRGIQVDLSLLGVGTWVVACAIQSVLSRGEEPKRLPRNQTVNPMSNYYNTKDNAWLMIVCLPDEPYWSPLCKVLERADLENDPRFHTRGRRLENNIELIQIIDAIMATKTRDEWAKILDDHDMVWTHIPSSFEEVINDPQVLANEHIVDVEHPSLGPAKTLTTPIRLNKQAPKIRNLAPEIGQHNEEILLGLGYTWEDINALQEKGVIP